MGLSFLAAFNGMTILYIFLAILVFLLMILIHETGHYVAGRILKFKINEFSIGFGKAIFSKINKRGEKISIRIFPLGGYCAFEGENEEGQPNNPQAFNSQKPWKRMIVLFSGAFFNFLSAILFSFILLVSFGFDIVQVKEDAPEYKLQAGDAIYQVDGKDVNFATNGTFSQLIRGAGKDNTFTLTVKRVNQETGNDEMVVLEGLTLQIETDEEGVETINFPQFGLYRRSFVEALGQCFVLTGMMAWVVLKSLWLLITFQLSTADVGGPIATIGLIATSSQVSIVNLFILLPLISANLAMFNLLPFPALDGFQMVFTGIEWIRRKPIKAKIKGIINGCGLVFLLTLVVVLDILHFVI